jgi:hypothetical protein
METRVYGIDSSKIYDHLELISLQENVLSDEYFIEIAEEHGLVWSLKGFSHDYNIDDIPNSVYIRII